MNTKFKAESLFKGIATVIFLMGYSFVSNSLAGIQPSFDLERLAWQASNMAVVTEDTKVFGKCIVIEAWKGGLKPGDPVIVPELVAFASVDRRAIHRWPSEAGTNLPTHVSGSRAILFLRKTASGSWEFADKFGGVETSVAWIEQSQAYGFVQEMNPGPSLLVPLHLSESEMKARALDVVQTQEAITNTTTITDLSQRAVALKLLTSPKHFFARISAFDELGKCGEAALPVLRGMLNDQSLLAQHGDVIGALTQAGGSSVAAELTKIVETETQFWNQAAPGLKQGWWNGSGFQWPAEYSKVEFLRNRYVKLYAALGALDGLKYNDCKTAVTQLRDVWRSHPQLEQIGLGQMSQKCDGLLKELH